MSADAVSRVVWAWRDPPRPAAPRRPRAPLVGLIAGAALWAAGRHGAGLVAAGVAALTLLGWALAPSATSRALDALGRAAGWALTAAALGAAYLLVLTPARLLRAGGRDPMQRRITRDAATYWLPRAGRPSRPERPF